MARNSEKRLSGLNRFLEAKETEKNAKLQRPPLCQLESADEVKGWVPSIEKEISYLLKQIEGKGSRRHNDAKIEEFKERIDFLKREHKRFVAKVRSLDPSYQDVVPWQPRGYRRKRGREEQPLAGAEDEGEKDGGQVKKLVSLLLEKEERLHTQDARRKPGFSTQDHHSGSHEEPPPVAQSCREHNPTIRTEEKWEEVVQSVPKRCGGLLGLDYSSSSEDEDKV